MGGSEGGDLLVGVGKAGDLLVGGNPGTWCPVGFWSGSRTSWG